MEMRYREGDVLFREGDPSDFVGRILEGRIAVEKDYDGEAVRLGELGLGDVVGEMGVIERKPRSATVRALSEVAVDLIPADEFLERIAADPEAAHNLLFRLSEKVRALSDEVVRLRHPPEADPTPAAPPVPVPATQPDSVVKRHIQLYQRSATASTRIGLRYEGKAGAQTVWIEHLPSCVARTANGTDPFSIGRGVMRVPDIAPCRLSNPHFAIDRDERLGLVIRDLGSEFGTTVNGQYLGGIFARDTQILQLGQNTVVAGGVNSPHRFRIEVSG